MTASGKPTDGTRLHLHILGSGSKGNCALVEGPEGLIMIDAGLSRRETLARMHQLGLDEGRIRALVLTHEHTDHVSGAPVWCKHFEGALFASAGTVAARERLRGLPFREFAPGDVLHIADVEVATFPTSHDVVNPVGFRFSCAGDSIGYATDTGMLPPGAVHLLAGARILALECNHDVAMLRCGPYPRMLQARIASERGHLSNAQAAEVRTHRAGEQPAEPGGACARRGAGRHPRQRTRQQRHACPRRRETRPPHLRRRSEPPHQPGIAPRAGCLSGRSTSQAAAKAPRGRKRKRPEAEAPSRRSPCRARRCVFARYSRSFP